MKKIVLAIAVSIAVISCKQEKNSEEVGVEVAEFSIDDYENFGAQIPVDLVKDALEAQNVLKTYEGMAVGDSVEITMKSEVKEVCKKKGCWMKLDLEQDGKEVIVNFKDYKFFVPMDSEGTEAIVHGKAFKREISVDELRHRAMDAGKTDGEIEAITEPELKYDFVADGVLLKKKA